MNSMILTITSVLVCSIANSDAFFLHFDWTGKNRGKQCTNLTALDVDWAEVIEPSNNWNLFYMNYYEASFYETGDLSTCIQINYTTTSSQKNPDDVIGKFTATKLTTSNTDPNKQIRYIYSSIADVQKTCNRTWTVAIPEKKITNKVTIPIYNEQSKYFCLAKCNNQCGETSDEENGTIECYSQDKQAADTFKQEHPGLAAKGRFLECSLL